MTRKILILSDQHTHNTNRWVIGIWFQWIKWATFLRFDFNEETLIGNNKRDKKHDEVSFLGGRGNLPFNWLRMRMACLRCLTPRPIKNDLQESCACVHTARRQTSTQIPIVICIHRFSICVRLELCARLCECTIIVIPTSPIISHVSLTLEFSIWSRLLMECSHCPTQNPTKNGLYRIVWSCSHCTETTMPLSTVAIHRSQY